MIKKKLLCASIRVVSMALILFVLQRVYAIGLAGCVMIASVCIIWALTTDIENEM